jgi:peptidoglycan/xylan/chitin deacetylase (PgdA/CDA1 family)
MRRVVKHLLCALGLIGLLGLAGCQTTMPPELPLTPVSSLPVRFLLSFDDGPSGSLDDNTTARVLDTLAHNRWQNGIKAIFFVQTRHPAGGGTPIGQQLMRRIFREGHLLALHTASSLGHINHTQIPLGELDLQLDDGIEDIRHISGDVPAFIRPPFWAYNEATLARYQAHGLTMLLDDITIRDGKVRGYTSNPHVRAHIRADLERAARRVQAGEIPAVSGYIPLVMTMHDTNPTTAHDLESYLGMLLDEARRVGFVVDGTPFISPRAELVRVANARGQRPAYAGNADSHTYR